MKITIPYSIIIVYLINIFLVDITKEEKPSNLNVLCPPYHEDSKGILMRFLTSDDYQDKREELSMGLVSEEDVSYLKTETDAASCERIQEIAPWPREYYHRVYFQSKGYFFIVDKLKPIPPPEDGKFNIHTGNNLILILDKKYNPVGSLFL